MEKEEKQEEVKVYQATVNMDEALEADIKEFAKREEKSFAKMGRTLLQQAIKEKKRLAEKAKKKTSKAEE